MYLTDKLRKNIFLSLCVIMATALNYFESLFVVSGIIPGIKIGISNIIVLTVIYMYSYREALAISIFKSVFIALLFGNGTSFLYSLAGGVTSAIIMTVFKNMKGLSSIGVSMIGSFMHITAQFVTAFVLLNSETVFYYYPYMLLIGTVTGFINGFLVKMVLMKLKPERRF